MGSGTPIRGGRRAPAGGVSASGVTTVGCPSSGAIDVAPTAEAVSGAQGALKASADGVTLVVGRRAIASASGPSAVRLKGCLADGISYSGTLLESEGRWEVQYRES
jgi:hypothetical protein